MPELITKDGLKLAYQDDGDGLDAPILCLAGLTRTGADFDQFVASLGPGRRIIRLDARGRGGSDWDPEISNYTMAQEAEDAAGLLRALDIDGAVAIGSSRGAVLAMLIAANAPGLLSGIVMNDAGPDASVETLRRLVEQVGGPIPFQTVDQAAKALAKHLAPTFPDWREEDFHAFAARSFLVTPTGLSHNFDPAIRTALEAQLVEIEAEGHQLWPAFEALGQTPTLVLKAEHSNILDAPTLDRMRQIKPDMVLRHVPRVGHAPRLDEPEALAAIREFLDKIDHDRRDRHPGHPWGGGTAFQSCETHPSFRDRDFKPRRRAADFGQGRMPPTHRQL